MLATKLFQPPLRSDLVARPRLTGLLDEAVRQGCSLILVCAPPGFGKSMMVASWLSERAAAERPLASAWFSLDRNDNDPVAFWRYVIAALSRVDPAIGRSMDAALVAGQPPALEPLITGLINDLTKPLFGQETPSARTWHSGAPLILVLDDYHVIEAEAIHQSLSFFIDHLPSNTAVVVITRVDPPLALARRRARQQLAEVRVNGLRFTRAETGEFLAKSGLDLVDEDLSVLEQRAEGWVVGLQLAALSLRDCTDRHAFITAFAGDNRYVVDYLLEEVLQHLPANIQDFLLKTSILERFCAALCDDVIRDSSIRSSEEREQLFSHIPDPETQITNSQSIISHLEQSNLFTLPLDSQRRWYRYHHLFADLLRRRLRQSLSGAEILELYRRACAWFERAGLPEEAVSLALAAPDYASAADIMERHVLAFYYRSEAAIIKRWFQALPEDMLRSRPLLCAVKACLISLSPPYPPESTRLAEEWLCQAEKSLQDRGESMDEARGFITQFRPYLSRFKQEPLSIVIALTHQALEALPPEDDPRAAGNANFLRFRSALITNLGLVNLSLGNVEEAAQVLRDSRRLGLKCGDLFNASASTTFLALISIIQGQLPEAFAICRDFLLALQNATPRSPGPVPYASTVGITMGSILAEWDRVEEAERLLLENIELAERSAGNSSLKNAYMTLARLAMARGDTGRVFDLLDQADQNWSSTVFQAESQRIRALIMLGAADSQYRGVVVQWCKGRAFRPFSPDPVSSEKEVDLILARAMVARYAWQLEDPTSGIESLDAVLAWLDQAGQAAEARGWLHWAIKARLVETLARQAVNDSSGALAALHSALAMAEPGGYIRLFADEMPGLAALLRKIATGGPFVAYARRILAASYPGKIPSRVETSLLENREGAAPRPEVVEPLVEPLSKREMEVLRLLAKGATNAEIANQLVVAPSTAKKHVIHILGKLGVSSRSKAIHRARELGLID